MTNAIALAERQGSLQHNEHSRGRFTRREKARTARIVANGAEPPYASDVRLRQHRKELVPSALYATLRFVSHSRFRRRASGKRRAQTGCALGSQRPHLQRRADQK
jgi:hypothetical protein